MARQLKVSTSTMKAWARKKDASTPDTPFLLRLAREEGLNLNWLLLGEDPMLRYRRVRTLQGYLLAMIEAELRTSEKVSDDEAEQMWAQMAVYETEGAGYNAILKLAAEGVRPLYRQLLTSYRVLEAGSMQFQSWANAWQRGENVSPAEALRRAEEYARVLRKALGLGRERVEVPGVGVFVKGEDKNDGPSKV